MTAELRRNLVLVAIGLLGGFGLIVALFGGGEMMKRPFAPSGQDASPATADGKQTGGTSAEEKSAEKEAAPARGSDTAAGQPNGGASGSQADKALPPGASATGDAGADTKPAANAPSFDLVRVEPTGETVVAGRGAPNTAVEMLVNGKPVARALADPNGQFALVPPALPAGDSEIVLRIVDPQGRETRSAQSVAVVVAPDRKTRPLVALSAPGRPTVVLSQPDAVAANEAPPDASAARVPGSAGSSSAGGSKAGAAKPGDSRSADAKAAPGPQGQSGKTAAAAARPAAPGKAEAAKVPSALKIVSVDAQEGGRLYVTGQASPGATVRLYLNDTLVAPASVGPDGKVVFTIGKGVAAGAYRVRIDQVDSVTGAVKTRAEVPFTFPEAAARIAAREPAGEGATVSRPDQGKAVAALPPAGVRPEPGPKDGQTAASAPAQAKAPKTAAPSPPASTPASSPAPGSATAERETPKVPEPAAATPAASLSASAQAQSNASGPAASADAPGAAFVAEIATARITRGDNLWQISRKVYGSGVRYTVIYDANQDQIRDPDRIFPGQIFVLPKDAPNKDTKTFREGRGGRG